MCRLPFVTQGQREARLESRLTLLPPVTPIVALVAHGNGVTRPARHICRAAWRRRAVPLVSVPSQRRLPGRSDAADGPAPVGRRQQIALGRGRRWRRPERDGERESFVHGRTHRPPVFEPGGDTQGRAASAAGSARARALQTVDSAARAIGMSPPPGSCRTAGQERISGETSADHRYTVFQRLLYPRIVVQRSIGNHCISLSLNASLYHYDWTFDIYKYNMYVCMYGHTAFNTHTIQKHAFESHAHAIVT